METLEPLFHLNLFGYSFGVTDSILVMWILTALIAVCAIALGRNLKNVPDGKQNKVEMVVDAINNLVKENMGEKYVSFIPYVGTLAIFLFAMNVIGLFGIEPPTRDYNLALALAILSFVIVQVNAIKKAGPVHYVKGYFHPFAFLFPLNLLERVMLPVSLSLRLFGNMTAAVVVVNLVYTGLGSLGFIAQLGIPVPVHAFFDIFDAVMQMFIFVMLTMINIRIVEEH